MVERRRAGTEQEEAGPEEAHVGRDTELHAGRLVGFGFGLAGIVAAGALACWALFGSFGAALRRADPPPSPVPGARDRVLPPEPRLQESPPADMAALRAWEEERLSGYGPVDKQQGTARIPIDRAIELVAAGITRAPGPRPAEVPDGGVP